MILRQAASQPRNKGPGHLSGAFFFGGDKAMIGRSIEMRRTPLALHVK
jgi:hypothetical protein